MEARNKVLTISQGVSAGMLMAIGIAWFAGVAYREGDLLTPAMMLVVAFVTPFLLYEQSAKRLIFSLVFATLLSGLSLLVISLGGQASGATLFGLYLVALAIPISIDLVLQDFGSRVTVSSRFAHSALGAFLIAILPLMSWIVTNEHHSAVEEDDALMRTVAQNVIPQGDTIVFEQVNPQQKDRLKRLVSVRTKERTYSLSDAEVESVVEERTVRRETRQQTRSELVSKEQAERMRLILNLQGSPLPEDITLVSHRGPVTVSELKVSLDKKNPG